jgi:Protein of unknown function (DUF664)
MSRGSSLGTSERCSTARRTFHCYGSTKALSSTLTCGLQASESRSDIIRLYQQATQHADATIDALSLDAPGRVPWWPPEREHVTLQQIMVHVSVEVARHAGHADIIRELIDGAAGDKDGNLPDQTAEE